MRATRAIIHIDIFKANILAVRERIGPRRKICVPVKAGGYGHGAEAIAAAALEAGADYLAVADVSEGAALRAAGIQAPVLLFSQALPAEVPDIIHNRLIPFVSDSEYINLLKTAAADFQTAIPVHLKIDTGMCRLGCAPHEAADLAKLIVSAKSLVYAGTATHLAVSDSAAAEDIACTRKQLACFRETLERIRAAGISPGLVHAANSGGVLLHGESWFDMVRPGILLYGYKTVQDAAGLPPMEIKPVMELRTNVVLIRPVKKGETVSYGRTWTAPADTTIAVLPAGYADGLPRPASGKWQVFINGRLYPLAGRICMDQCMADLGPNPPVRRWDEAVIFGGPAPSAAGLALAAGTIPYEITCNINKRVPRVYETRQGG